jgi:hypothetical protein
MRNREIIVSNRPSEGENQWWANCPKCGALLYATVSSLVIKEVLTAERPYCFHCGIKIDASKVVIDKNRYCDSAS